MMGQHLLNKRASSPRRHAHVGAPDLLHSLLEARALLEIAMLPTALPLLLQAPAGDGHPVLLLPGFLADERSLVALELLLKLKGYAVETWGLGRNVGFHTRYLKALEHKIRDLHLKSGRKVSLVGWSLGGVFGIVAAHLAPETVRSIVTLGSPVSATAGESHASPAVKALYRIVARHSPSSAHAAHPRARDVRRGLLPQVPISCLYTLSDGVVPPHCGP